MDESAITMTADDDWWLERVTMDGEQRYPERIRVGSLENPRVYVPERTCRIVSAKEAGRAGYAPACSSCGWQSAVWHQYSYCPNCGARIRAVDE